MASTTVMKAKIAELEAKVEQLNDDGKERIHDLEMSLDEYGCMENAARNRITNLESQIALNVDYSKQVAKAEAEVERLRAITNPGDAAAHEEREALHEHAIASKDARIRELEAALKARNREPDMMPPRGYGEP